MTQDSDNKVKIVNPKDAVAAAKIDMSLLPGTGLAHTALALMNGDFKYQKYNWRDEDKKINMSVYLGAIDRHLKAFNDKEDYASDSGVHHLGHIAAGALILLDAIESGQAIDDRVKGNTALVLERLAKQYKNELLPRWQAAKNDTKSKI